MGTPVHTTAGRRRPVRRHAPGDRWFVDETYVKVGGRWLRAMRGLHTDRTAQTVIAGHAFVQNMRRGHYELAVEVPPASRVAASFTEFVHAI